MNSKFLLERRKQLGISQTDIADKLGYSPQMVSIWESGKSVPNIQIWSKYASILEIDLEGFIFDKIQKKNDNCDSLSFDSGKFSKNIKKLRMSNNLTQVELSKTLSISNKTLSYIENGNPAIDTNQFIELMEYFHCSCDELYFVISVPKEVETPKKKYKAFIIIPIVLLVVIGSGVTVAAVSLSNNSDNASSIYQSNEDYHWIVDENNNPINQQAHKFDSYISKKPTCIEQGETISTCQVCGYVKTEIINPTGHQADGDWHFDRDYHYHICSIDKVTFDKELHNFDQGNIFGNKVIYTCVDCLFEKEEDINGHVDNGEYLYYGLYPQSHVSDSELISALDALTESDDNGYYLYNESYYYKATAKLYYSSNQTSAIFSDGEYVENDKSYWFNVEPIKWDILEITDNDYLLLSHSLIDVRLYSNGSNNYKDSLIREWLNNEFYSKAFFSDNERIIVTEVNNSLSSTLDQTNNFVCDNTFDKVWLPSHKEMSNSTYGFDNKENRISYLTDFAKINETWMPVSDLTYYYTRTPANTNNNTLKVVDNIGNIINNQIYDDLNLGVRPMIRVSK